MKREDARARYRQQRRESSLRQKAQRDTIRGMLRPLLGGARDRAKAKHYKFDIDLDLEICKYMEQLGRCQLTRIPFSLRLNPGGKRFNDPFMPSIHRTVLEKGYTKDNIVLVCLIVNLAINNFGINVFTRMCESYIEENDFLIVPTQLEGIDRSTWSPQVFFDSMV
ncbi:hypothetical protein OMAG_002470 [Candidatus Omnitrophus magneticus]|uniref:Uncharacterized protein n=1 Tax=Candidatus Omnitrophus magneticus TaxID=1609969 RepID=A0A0F0CQ84_9BACT|nr:hypothetical protein OMAG_002470 [Candidatus Omnitrophus magneticus]